ncbi:MAG: aminopeptidase P N-terminal domain-containing protein [Patescibacteria group bacterium]
MNTRKHIEIIRTKLEGYPLIISGNELVQLSGDQETPFCQEASFFWLTNIDEPGWQLILDDKDAWLVSPTKSEIEEIFNGSSDFEDIRMNSGIDTIISQKESESIIENLHSKYEAVYTVDPIVDAHHMVPNPTRAALIDQLRNSFKEVRDVQPIFYKLRAIKSEDEIKNIQKAIDVSIGAFNKVKENIDTYNYEYEIEADFSYAFRHEGAQGHAYEPIVASGRHACTLHYNKNNEAVEKNALVLLDIGARWNGYAADITRTYAVGEVSEREKAVHAAVERAHYEIISLLKPELGVKEYHEKVDEIMKRELKELGLLNKPDDYRTYFPHAVSHGLGIDVHDPLGMPKTFKPGMVLTVEPGIYIPEEGIGVRIEDNILITETGHKNLSETLSTSL